MSLSKSQILTLHNAMETHQRKAGVFEGVNMWEPKNAPQKQGVSASTWLQAIGPARSGSGLVATTSRLEYRTRIYCNMLRAEQDHIDPDVLAAAATLLDLYSADFTLGGLIRQIDLLGQFGTPLSGTAGYINIEGKFYRVLDITVPLIVNDVWTQAP